MNLAFDQVYDAQAAQAEAMGIPLWEIPLEQEAYFFAGMVG